MSADRPEPTRHSERGCVSLERRKERDAQRYPAHEDPERVTDPDEEE
jgi:hypothetical protein